MSIDPTNIRDIKSTIRTTPGKISFDKLKPYLKNDEKLGAYEEVFKFFDKKDNYNMNGVKVEFTNLNDGLINMNSFNADKPLELLTFHGSGDNLINEDMINSFIKHENLDFTVEDTKTFLIALYEYCSENRDIQNEQLEDDIENKNEKLKEQLGRELPEDVFSDISDSSSVTITDIGDGQSCKLLINNEKVPNDRKRGFAYSNFEYICDDKQVYKKTEKVIERSSNKILSTIETIYEDGIPGKRTEVYSTGLTKINTPTDNYREKVTTKMGDSSEKRDEYNFVEEIELNTTNDALYISIKPMYNEDGYITDFDIKNKNNLPVNFQNKDELLKILNSHNNDNLFLNYNLSVKITDNMQNIYFVPNE